MFLARVFEVGGRAHEPQGFSLIALQLREPSLHGQDLDVGLPGPIDLVGRPEPGPQLLQVVDLGLRCANVAGTRRAQAARERDVFAGDHTTNNIIRNNTIYENNGSGIYAVGTDGWTIEGNTCRDNNFNNVNNAEGITVQSSRNLIIRNNTLAESARLFAMISVAQADGAIVCWEVKYRYNFWRPVTAILRADEDNNPLTEADRDWAQLLPSPPFPAYTSGHSTFSKASAELLRRFYGTDAITFTMSLPYFCKDVRTRMLLTSSP
jgi:parallel beta-helix repeat protein